MTNRLTKQGRSVYVPGVASKPAMPAYCVSAEAVASTAVGPRSGSTRSPYSASSAMVSQAIPGRVTVYEAMQWEGNNLPTPPGFSDNYQGNIECYKAQPAVVGYPATITADPIPGWNAGARSIPFLSGNGYVKYTTAPRPVGVVAGLSSVDESAGFAEATHAFYSRTGSIQVVERGVIKATAPYAPLAGYDLIIARRDNVVTYYVHDWVYVSTVLSDSVVYLDAALYAVGDFVDNPVVGLLADIPALLDGHGSGAAQLRALQGLGSAADYGEGDATLPAVQGVGTGFQTVTTGGAAVLRPLLGVGADRPYAAGAAQLSALLAEGTGGFPIVQSATGSFVLPPIVAGGVGFTGTLGNGAVTLEPVTAYGADRPYATGNAVLSAIYGYGDDGPEPGSYGTMEFMYLVDRISTDPTLFAMIMETLGIGTSMIIVLTFDTSYYDGLVLADDFDLGALLYAAINDGLILNSNLSTARAAAIQYAVNIATGALTTYQNFDFHGFAQAPNKRTLAWRPDGVYEVGGALDDGQTLNALVDFGSDDFGLTNKKHIPGVFLGLGTDGQAYVRMTPDDGCERVYKVIQRSDVSRANPARGLTAREWHVKLEIVDASSAVLDTIEFDTEITTRRWTR